MSGGSNQFLFQPRIDWSEAARDTDQFVSRVISEVNAELSRLQASAQLPTGTTGRLTPGSYGGQIARLEAEVRRIQSGAAGAGISRPGLSGLLTGTDVQRALRLKVPGFGDARGASAITSGYAKAQQALTAQAQGQLAAGAKMLALAEEERDAAEERASALRRLASYELALAQDAERQVALYAEAEALRKQRVAAERRAVNAILDESVGYEENLAASRASEERRRVAVERLSNSMLGASYAQERGLLSLQKEALALEERLTIAQQALSVNSTGLTLDKSIIETKARVLEAERLRANAENSALAQLKGQLVGPGFQPFLPNGPHSAFIPGGPPTGGTRFQQIYSRIIGARGGGEINALNVPTLKQFVGQRLLSTAAFGVSGAALFGAVKGVRDIITNAQELQQQMARIEATFKSLGQEADVGAFKKGILDIARTTGVASKDVANIARQLKGAFGNEGNDVVLKNAEAAAKLIQVTGLSQQEVVDGLTAASKTLGVSFEELGDKSIGIEQRFGVNANETLAFFGDLAASAKEVGFDLNDLSAIAGVAQQRSGRTGSQLAEAFSRVLPIVKETSVEIFKLFRENGAPQDLLDKLGSSIKAGKPGDTLLTAVRGLERLDKESRKNVQSQFIRLLGGQRQAFAVTALIQGVHDLNTELGRSGKNLDDGLLNERFQAALATLQVKLQKMAESFRQFGQAIYEAGLGKLLESAAEAGTSLLKVMTLVLGVMHRLNDMTGGFLGQLIFAAIAARGIISLARVLGGIGLVGGIGRTLGGVRAGASILGGVRSLAELKAAGSLLGSSALGFVGGVPGAVAIGGTIAVGSYLSFRDRENARRERYRAALDRQGLTKLENEGPPRPSVLESVGDALFGRRSRRGIYQQEVAKKQASSLGLTDTFRGLGDKAYKNLLDQATGGKGIFNVTTDLHKRFKAYGGYSTSGDFQDREDFLTKLRNGDESALAFAKALADVLGPRRADAAKAAAGLLDSAKSYGKNGQAFKDLKTIKDAYDAGLATIGDYLAALDDQIKELERLGADDPRSSLNPQYVARLKERGKTKGPALYNAAKTRIDLEALGTGDDPEHARSVLTDLLKNPNLDPETKFKAANDIIDLTKQALSNWVGGAATEAEKIRRQLAGLSVPVEAQKAILEQLISEIDPEWSQFLSVYMSALTDVAGFVQDVVGRALAEGIGVGQATIELLQAMIADSEQKIGAVLAFVSETSTGVDVVAQLQAMKDALNAAKGLFDYKPPGKVTDKTGAATGADKADKPGDVESALLELEKARAGNHDALAEANFALRDAENQAKYAETEAEKIRAQARIIEAQNAVQDAIRDVFASRVDLMIAVAQAAGDDVEVARLGLQRLQAELNTPGLGETERNEILAQIQGQQAAIRDAELQQKRDDIEFQLQMGQITSGQAANLAQALLAIPTLTDKERKDIQLYIKQLRDAAGQDYQFNLPTELGLPTLYTARRLNQFGDNAGQQFNDNRVITISVSGVDSSLVVSSIVDELNKPSRFGLSPRIY